MSDLQILFPKPVFVAVGRRTVSIRPVTMEHFEDFGKAAGGVLNLLVDASPDKIYAYAAETGALRTILGTCTSLNRWSIKRLPMAAAVELMIHVINLNSGFFDQALARAAVALAGAKSSKR